MSPVQATLQLALTDGTFPFREHTWHPMRSTEPAWQSNDRGAVSFGKAKGDSPPEPSNNILHFGPINQERKEHKNRSSRAEGEHHLNKTHHNRGRAEFGSVVPFIGRRDSATAFTKSVLLAMGSTHENGS